MVEIIATDDFREWYQDDLDDVAGRAVFEMVAKLEQFGTQLPLPLSSALNGSKYPLRELCVKAGGHQLNRLRLRPLARRGAASRCRESRR